jgi:hypothetical protein
MSWGRKSYLGRGGGSYMEYGELNEENGDKGSDSDIEHKIGTPTTRN